MAGITLRTARQVVPMIYAYTTPEIARHNGWPKIEVVRKEISDTPVSFQPLAVVGDIPGADFGLEDAQALADWLVAQMPGL